MSSFRRHFRGGEGQVQGQAGNLALALALAEEVAVLQECWVQVRLVVYCRVL